MEVAVVAYARLEPVDLEWVEGSRAVHDPNSSAIAPHFTLMFPVQADPPEVEQKLLAVARSFHPIDFELGRVEPQFGLDGLTYVFLVPTEGSDEIVAVFERLYRGVRRPHGRSVPTFTPHVTVGRHESAAVAERQVQSLLADWRPIRGTIDALDLLGLDNGHVEPLATFPFGPR